MHGYAIARWIEDATDDALAVEEGSLYPALYRMEKKGWVEAEWGTSELGRRAKLYRLTRARPPAAGGRHRRLGRRSPPPSTACSSRCSHAAPTTCVPWLWRVPVEAGSARGAGASRRAAHARPRRRRHGTRRPRGPKPSGAWAIRGASKHAAAPGRRAQSHAGRGGVAGRTRPTTSASRCGRHGCSPASRWRSVLTLGIGLGATTAIFSVVHAVVLAPFPFAEPERVLFVDHHVEGRARATRPSATSTTSASALTTLDPMAASAFIELQSHRRRPAGADLGAALDLRRTSRCSAFRRRWAAPSPPTRISRDATRWSCSATASGSGASAADPDVVGRQLRLNNEAYEVIGVMPRVLRRRHRRRRAWSCPSRSRPNGWRCTTSTSSICTAGWRAGVSLAQVNDELGARRRGTAAGSRAVQRRSRRARTSASTSR